MKNLFFDGGPAFPESVGVDLEGNVIASENPGLSIRDWFAGMALQDLVTQTDDAVASHAHAALADEYAGAAYTLADAMLAARAT